MLLHSKFIPLWLILFKAVLIYADSEEGGLSGIGNQTESSNVHANFTPAGRFNYSDDGSSDVTSNNNSELLEGTEVNELPNSTTTVLPERTFEDEEKAIVDYWHSMLRQLLPFVMSSSSSSTSISAQCVSAMMKIFSGLRRLNGWTLKMLDSSGKLSPGIISGRLYSMGDYDQCLGISVNKRGKEATNPNDEYFHGSYCIMQVEQQPPIIERARAFKEGRINASQLGKLRDVIRSVPFVPVSRAYMSHFIGICVPSLCDEEDLGIIIESFKFPEKTTIKRCQSKEEVNLDSEERVILGLFAFLVFLVLCSSIAHLLFRLFPDRRIKCIMSRKCANIMTSFSIFLNTKKLTQKIRNDSDEIPDSRSVRGLVVLTVICLTIYNTYLPPFKEYYMQTSYLKNLEEYMEKESFSLIVCLPIFIEIFFFSYGFSMGKTFWKDSLEHGRSAAVIALKLALFNYVRLLIPVIFCAGVVVLLPVYGSGPFWQDIFGATEENCKVKWTRIITLILNFLDLKDQCFPNFWLFSCLMQLTFFSLVLLLLLKRWPKFGLLMTVASIFGSITIVGLIASLIQLPPSYVEYFTDRPEIQWNVQVSWPFNHVSSSCIGMLMGILIAKKTEIRISRFVVFCGWIIALGMIFGVCMITTFENRSSDFVLTTASAVFAALQRPLFIASVAWIFLVCCYRCGGPVNSLLSWSVLDPLYKLSYFAYFIQLIVIAFHVASAREQFHYSHSELLLRAVSYIVVTYGIAYFAYMMIIMPFASLREAISTTKLIHLTVVSSNDNSYTVNKVRSVPATYDNPSFTNKLNGDQTDNGLT